MRGGRGISSEPTFVTFGTPNFSQARARYLRSLARFGYRRVLACDPDTPAVRKARTENPEIFAHARGYGYWLWKPYIIEAALDEAPPGGIVFYSDIACEMVGDPARMLQIGATHDVCTFRIGGGLRQRQFTKRDCFVLLDADRTEFWDDEMVNGGFLLVRNTPRAREIVAGWKSAMRDFRVLSDEPAGLGHPELPELISHRHDQSVLSIIATRERLPILADPSQWGRGRDGTADLSSPAPRLIAEDFGQVFHQHRRRDATPVRRLARWLKQRIGR